MDFGLDGTPYQSVLPRCYLRSPRSGDVLHESPRKFPPVVSVCISASYSGFTGAVILFVYEWQCKKKVLFFVKVRRKPVLSATKWLEIPEKRLEILYILDG